MITVRQLIAKLKKLPPGAIVVTRDHDQSADEMNMYVRTVLEAKEALLNARPELAGEKAVVISS